MTSHITACEWCYYTDWLNKLYITYLQGGPKMAQSFWYALTSSNINRFSKLFHYQNQEKMCNNTITKDPTHTSNVLLHYLVKYLQSNNWKQDDFCNNTFLKKLTRHNKNQVKAYQKNCAIFGPPCRVKFCSELGPTLGLGRYCQMPDACQFTFVCRRFARPGTVRVCNRPQLSVVGKEMRRQHRSVSLLRQSRDGFTAASRVRLVQGVYHRVRTAELATVHSKTPQERQSASNGRRIYAVARQVRTWPNRK